MAIVELVPFAEAHLETTYRWMSDSSLRWGLLVDGEITWEDHRAWFAAQQSDSTRATFAVLVDGEHVGNFGYRHLSPRHRTGELWMYLGPDHHNKGLAEPAMAEGLRRGFQTLELRKIYLVVRTDNLRAIRLYARAGFVVEGILQAEQLFDGRPVDVIRMALFKADEATLTRAPTDSDEEDSAPASLPVADQR